MSFSLPGLGWSAFFLSQLDPSEIGQLRPARVAAVHRDRIEVLAEAGPLSLVLPASLSTADLAVGDWVLAEPEVPRVARLLDRRSDLHRRAPGSDATRQLIAANLDGLAIVTSCNAEYSTARLERYLALARASGIAPVVVLTKADLADPAPWADQAVKAARDAPVLAVDARDPVSVARLTDWCGRGHTLGLVGSSGVGKSTLAATLTGQDLATAGTSVLKDKGRHTTTARHLVPTLGGGWLIDTPGMRELQLADAAEGIAATFDDIEALAQDCRFSDCAHQGEPGCAVARAVEDGSLDPARLNRWRKLKREDQFNAMSLAEARAKSRAFGRKTRDIGRQKEERNRW